MEKFNNEITQESVPSNLFEEEYLIKQRRNKQVQIIVFSIILASIAIASIFLARAYAKKGDLRMENMNQSISEIKKISEFCTAHYFGEVMIMDTEKEFLRKNKIVIIASGKIRAGFDLSKMETQIVNDTSITLMLPPVQILDIITNPSDFRTFSEKGKWSHNRVNLTKNAARKTLLDHALDDNLLDLAEENGTTQLTEMFKAFGFKHVNISFLRSGDNNHSEMLSDSLSNKAKLIK